MFLRLLAEILGDFESSLPLLESHIFLRCRRNTSVYAKNNTFRTFHVNIMAALHRKVAFFGPGPHFGLSFASLPWDGNIKEALGKNKFDPSYDIFLWGSCVLFPNILDNFHWTFSNIHDHQWIFTVDFQYSQKDWISIKADDHDRDHDDHGDDNGDNDDVQRKAPPHLLISSERLDQHMWPININIIVDWSIHYITWE